MKHREKGYKKQTKTINNSKNKVLSDIWDSRKQFNFLLILDCVEHIYRNYFNIINEHSIISIPMGLFLLILLLQNHVATSSGG